MLPLDHCQLVPRRRAGERGERLISSGRGQIVLQNYKFTFVFHFLPLVKVFAIGRDTITAL